MPNSRKIVRNRMVIYAKDVQNITGRSERTARLLLQRIREKNNKRRDQFVSISEFCYYTGLCESEVKMLLTS